VLGRTLGVEVNKRVCYSCQTMRGQKRRRWQRRVSSWRTPLESFVVNALSVILVRRAVRCRVEGMYQRRARSAIAEEQKDEERAAYHRSPVKETGVAASKAPGRRHMGTFPS
jgi:hypothetical protein